MTTCLTVPCNLRGTRYLSSKGWAIGMGVEDADVLLRREISLNRIHRNTFVNFCLYQMPVLCLWAKLLSTGPTKENISK